MHRLPEISGFDKLALNDAYMEAQAEQLTDLNIVMDDGGLKIDGAAECTSITGNGQLLLGENGSLTVTETAEGTFLGADGNGVHVHKYELKSDADKHWKECAYGNTKDEEAHMGGQASCKEKAVCDVCGIAYGEYDLNHHEGGTEVRNSKPATTEEKGYTGDTYCLGCNTLLEKGEEIPVLADEKKEDTKTDPKKDNVVKKDSMKKAQPVQKHGKVKTGDTASLWVGLMTLAVSFGGIVTVKRKHH